ncbi:copper ion transmembrane transporter [Thalictrum thalictroides]|uniref:Copper ion transmembrane transporter n=1 Tax=Thalictrum thalictroides TaxID=46969 RepID=A0A7J6W954_THATH|nr:copper ion transmembrane transporter [Thalictrum thalictroides]
MSTLLHMPPLLPTLQPSRNLSSIGVLTEQITHLSIHPIIPFRPTTTLIRMGGGPRTFPGGVSKWQWKRMQAKKQKQLLKARLCRERQIYEMRKRAELREAVSELERPWEVVERAPNLFSVSADEQLKTLADRFQRPGGYDLWSERDGPQLFHPVNGLPSARFLPKDAVHSVRPYGIRGNGDSLEEDNDGEFGNGNGRKLRSKKKRGSNLRGSGDLPRMDNQDVKKGLNNLRISSPGEERKLGERDGRLRNNRTRRNVESGNLYAQDLKQRPSETEKSRRVPLVQRGRSGSIVRRYNSGRDQGQGKPKVSGTREVYDMSLKQDGSYELQSNLNKKNMMLNGGLEDDFERDIASWRNSES